MESGYSQTSLFDWLRGRVSHVARGKVELSALPASVDPELAPLLQASLEKSLGTVDLIVTDNRRRMVSVKKRGRRYEFRVHHMFLGCEQSVADALVGLAKSRPSARAAIRDYVDANRQEIRHKAAELATRTLGDHHNLEDIMASASHLLAPHVFEDVAITWGRQGSGNRTIRFGSFDFERRLIRIHPTLDQDWVPHYFVEFVVFHELLHAVFPPEIRGGRRIIHSSEFREREKTFPDYDHAMTWERENLKRILRRR
jgi:hypothetical protein